MATEISVIVCTYNRADIIGHCLESLCTQTLDEGRFDVLVVDNNSTDNTAEMVKPFLHRPNFRYCNEETQGLSAARNRGLADSKGNFVAYLDDDAVANPNYLETVCKLLKTMELIPFCMGGPILPFYTTPKPAWFKDKYETRRLWNEPRYLTEGEHFSGSNMVWQRHLLEELGGFVVGYGMSGSQLALGEDTEVFRRVWELYEQPRFYYSPELIIRHWVPSHKMRISYQLARYFMNGQTKARLNKPSSGLSRLRRVISCLVLITFWTLRGILKIIKYPNWRNWIMEEMAQSIILVGEILGILNIQVKLSR